MLAYTLVILYALYSLLQMLGQGWVCCSTDCLHDDVPRSAFGAEPTDYNCHAYRRASGRMTMDRLCPTVHSHMFSLTTMCFRRFMAVMHGSFAEYLPLLLRSSSSHSVYSWHTYACSCHSNVQFAVNASCSDRDNFDASGRPNNWSTLLCLSC